MDLRWRRAWLANRPLRWQKTTFASKLAPTGDAIASEDGVSN